MSVKKTDFVTYLKMERELLIAVKRFVDDLSKTEKKYHNIIRKFNKMKVPDAQLVELLSKFFDSKSLSLLLVSRNRIAGAKDQIAKLGELSLTEKKQLTTLINSLIKTYDKLIDG